MNEFLLNNYYIELTIILMIIYFVIELFRNFKYDLKLFFLDYEVFADFYLLKFFKIFNWLNLVKFIIQLLCKFMRSFLLILDQFFYYLF